MLNNSPRKAAIPCCHVPSLHEPTYILKPLVLSQSCRNMVWCGAVKEIRVMVNCISSMLLKKQYAALHQKLDQESGVWVATGVRSMCCKTIESLVGYHDTKHASEDNLLMWVSCGASSTCFEMRQDTQSVIVRRFARTVDITT